jgi:hypothetical protein
MAGFHVEVRIWEQGQICHITGEAAIGSVAIRSRSSPKPAGEYVNQLAIKARCTSSNQLVILTGMNVRGRRPPSGHIRGINAEERFSSVI